MKTHKLEIVGEVDGEPFFHRMEFGMTDKNALIVLLTRAIDEPTSFSVVDIHGNVLAFNFERIKAFSVRVIEVFDIPTDSPLEE